MLASVFPVVAAVDEGHEVGAGIEANARPLFPHLVCRWTGAVVPAQSKRPQHHSQELIQKVSDWLTLR